MKTPLYLLFITLVAMSWLTFSLGYSAGPEKPADSNKPFPWSKTIDGVPYTQQPNGYTCGPTSLRMLMAYYGASHEVTDIANYMASIGHNPYPAGVGHQALSLAAEYYGFIGTVTGYGWEELKKSIAAGKPCIAHIYLKANEYPRYYPGNEPAYAKANVGHYVVVCGLEADADGNVLYVEVNDPSGSQGPKIKYTYSSWDQAWEQRDRRIITLK